VVGVGWLLLAIVDVSKAVDMANYQLVWILYLTSEEGTPFHRLLNAGGNGGMSNLTRRGPRRESTAAFATHSETGLGGGVPVGSGTGYSAPPRSNGGYPMGGTMGGTGMGYAPAATDTTPQKSVARDSYRNQSPPLTDNHYKHRAK
jgi:SHO1 osmosensor